MDIEGTWATQAYSSDVAESDVFRYSSTAGPSFEGPEVITIQDDDEVDPPILIADGAAEVNNRPKPEVIVIEDDDEVDAPTATAGYAAEVANGSEPLQAQAPSAVQRSDVSVNKLVNLYVLVLTPTTGPCKCSAGRCKHRQPYEHPVFPGNSCGRAPCFHHPSFSNPKSSCQLPSPVAPTRNS